ncbi:MAG: methyl-accepting chemotaxis protein [Candidatus Accumulibacter sp.]|jgi:twitching motility protein PilJ|nr:methyl-accepting chemotaxis protein [Accumulibacter sp.]
MAFKLSLPKIPGARNSGATAMTSKKNSPARGSQGFDTKAFIHPSVTLRLQLLGVLLLALLLASGAVFYRLNQVMANNAAYIIASGELSMLSQRVVKATGSVLRGDPLAFGILRDSRQRFETNLERLSNGGDLGGQIVPPSSAEIKPRIDTLASAWQHINRSSQQLLQAEKGLVIFGKYLRGLSVGTERGFAIGSERVYLRTPDPDQEVERAIGMLDAVFKDYAAEVEAILDGRQDLAEARRAAGDILVDDASIYDAADALTDAYRGLDQRERLFYEGLLFVPVVLILAVLAMIARVYIGEAHRQAAEAERNRLESEKSKRISEDLNRRNQDAILRLMNELGDLADGDLTVTATVSEDITGAIADSINYTVEELRVLVGRINDASSRVMGATEIAQRTSVELLEAAQRQSREIQEAGRFVLEVASAMNRVSGDANQSAQVARQSLAAAGKGTQAVQDSIKGMNEIREQIQETSKRIKRLGESSQEIGEIVELISDITEQTNVLALNAAIQAASAGEAGRGFTVVAEEVQRLAERSGEATKQIAAIVKTIQSDTQGAVSAMEESTRDVVEGTKLSDAAGRALSEIGAVSKSLAELIERISLATRKQADAATSVASKMQGILKVNERATAGTQKTASVVGELAGLATELKGSVAGFKVG